MTMMKLFHSHDYNAGNIINPFDEVVHIVHKKVQDIKNGLNIAPYLHPIIPSHTDDGDDINDDHDFLPCYCSNHC